MLILLINNIDSFSQADTSSSGNVQAFQFLPDSTILTNIKLENYLTDFDSIVDLESIIENGKKYTIDIFQRPAIVEQFGDSTQHLDRHVIFKNTYFKYLTIGANMSYFPIYDTSLIQPKINKAYWISTAAEIANLPINISISSNENIALEGFDKGYTTQMSFQFDYRQYITNVKTELLEKLNVECAQIKEQLAAFDFVDTSAFYDRIKDTLASQQYQFYISNLKAKQQQLSDSMSNCYEVDSLLVDSINNIISQYQTYQTQFKQMIALQNEYYKLLAKYDAAYEKVQGFEESISKANDFSSISDLANQSGFQTNLPQWPSRFKAISLGSQYVDHSPLTLQHYTSNGFAVHYENNNNIIIANALTQKNLPQFNVLTETDSLFNPYLIKQNLGLVAYGIGNMDSNFVLFTVSASQQLVTELTSEDNRINSIVSVYQYQNFLNKFYGTYEVAFTTLNDKNSNIQDDTLKHGNILNSFGAFTSLGYKFVQLNGQIGFEYSYLGLSYINLSNPFLLPGTTNSSIDVAKKFLNGRLSLSYKLTHTKPLSSNPNQSNYITHLGHFNYSGKKGLGLLVNIAPFQYSYQIQDQITNTSTSFGMMINGSVLINSNIKNIPITGIISYSNFSTQNTLADTVMLLNMGNINFNLNATFGRRNITAQGLYFVPGENDNSGLFNYYTLTCDFISNKKKHLALGPKYIDYFGYNDQIASTITGYVLLMKHLYWQFDIDKCFDIKQGQENAYANLFFNTTIGLTLNSNK